MSACRIKGSQSTTSPLILIPYGDGTQLQRKHVASSELPTAIASWDLDGDGLDGIASYDATLHGGGWGAGPSGYALDLDGTDDYADTSETFQSLFQASFGIELMFNTDDGKPATNQHLFGLTDAGVDNYCWARITVNGDISFVYSADGNAANAAPSVAPLSDGPSGWQHVVFTINTTTSLSYIYLNGSLVKSVSTAGVTMGDYAQNTNDLIFGANNYQGTPTDFLDGRIANVRLYDAAVSADEALALYNNIWFKEVTDEKMFRLPGVGLPESHEYEVLGTTEVESITAASSPEEL